MPNVSDQPVWEVYDLQRTCKMNAKYWSTKLATYRKCNFWMEYVLAISAPSSAVAGLVFWKTQAGAFLWSSLTIITAFLGIAKPLLKLADTIQNLQKVATGYRSLDFQLEQLGNDIRREKAYSKEMIQGFKRLESQVNEVTRDEPLDGVDEDLRQACYEAVKRELPAENFYIPPDVVVPPP